MLESSLPAKAPCAYSLLHQSVCVLATIAPACVARNSEIYLFWCLSFECTLSASLPFVRLAISNRI